jgi:FkbM family methyltransferase
MSQPVKTQFLDILRSINKIPFIEQYLVRLSLQKNALARKIIGSQTLYPQGTIRQCNRHGINYRLHINDYIDHGIYFGLHDQDDFNRNDLLSLISPGNIVLDIGANIGDTSLHMAQKLNGTGHIYAFEPSPHVFKRLQTNVALNPFKNISLFNEGMGDEVGELSFVGTSTKHTGGAFITKNMETGMKVKVSTIDTFVQMQQIKHIDLIKIDTEGFEVFVIKGAMQTLQHLRPVIFVEVSEVLLNRAGTSASQLFSLLQQLNYQCHRVDNGQPISPQYPFANCHFDAVCTPPPIA